MGTTATRRCAAHTRPGRANVAGLFYDRSLDRDLAELQRKGLARFTAAGAIAVTTAGLEALKKQGRGRK